VIKLIGIRLVRHEALMGQRRVVYRVLEEKREGKGVLGRVRFKWEIIIRWNFRKLNWGY